MSNTFYGNFDELSSSEARDLLRKWRESNERRSEETIVLWNTFLESELHKLGNEKHVVLEQIVYAALDCHDYVTANFCIYVLSNEFPGSLRVMRLHAALLEARGKYDEALKILDDIIKADETNAPARKRRVVIWKAQGNQNEAIKELIDYIKKFMSDVEAWQELCDIYLQVQDYSKAVFCAEEMLIHQPHNHLMHQRVADIRYTMGGIENMELAKSYYCQALKINPDNMRAILGLFLVSNNLVSQYKSAGNSARRKEGAEAARAAHWAQRHAALLRAEPLHLALHHLAITD